VRFTGTRGFETAGEAGFCPGSSACAEVCFVLAAAVCRIVFIAWLTEALAELRGSWTPGFFPAY
jgi:hypothetical protein